MEMEYLQSVMHFLREKGAAVTPLLVEAKEVRGDNHRFMRCSCVVSCIPRRHQTPAPASYLLTCVPPGAHRCRRARLR